MLDIYVGNLPDRTSAAELRELFDGVAGQKPRKSLIGSLLPKLRKMPPAAAAEFKIIDTVQSQHARYCRITGNTRAEAGKIISQLSGAGLHGHVLEVRPFYPRLMTNDRRRAGWLFRTWLGVERRVSERRAEIEDV